MIFCEYFSMDLLNLSGKIIILIELGFRIQHDPKQIEHHFNSLRMKPHPKMDKTLPRL